MPRPFLGPSNSQTGPQRSRLQGGVPQSSSSGPIAEGGLQAPALQALQQIVSTFQSPGRTNLGGPTEIPAAPQLQLPQRTPTPTLPQAFNIPVPVTGQTIVNPPKFGKYYDGWGALVDSLGAFSRGLDKLSQGAIAMEESKHVRAKSSGQSLALQAQQQGFNSIAELQKHLEKQIEEGVPGAEQMLQRVEGSSPLQLRYATVNLQDATLKNNLYTLQQRLKETPVLEDGTPIEQVHPMDPRWQKQKMILAFPQGIQGLLPEVHQGNQALIAAQFGTADSAQLTRHINWKAEKAQRGMSAQTQTIVLGVLEGGGVTTPEVAAQQLSLHLNDVYNNSGQRNRIYQKLKTSLPTEMAKVAAKWAAGDPAKYKIVMETLPNILNGVVAGPNGERLVDQLPPGSSEAMTEAFQKEWYDLEKTRDQRDKQLAANIAEKKFLQATKTDEQGNTILTDPAKLQQKIEDLEKKAVELFPNDPYKQLAYKERLNKLTTSATRVWTEPVQEERANYYYRRMGSGQNIDVENVWQDMEDGKLQFSTGRQILREWSSISREENKQSRQLMNNIKRDYNKKIDANPNFEAKDNDGNPIDKQMFIRGLDADYTRRALALINENSGQQVTKEGKPIGQALEELGKEVYGPSTEAPATNDDSALYPDPSIMERRDKTSRGNQMRFKDRLKKQAIESTRPLFTDEVLVELFNAHESPGSNPTREKQLKLVLEASGLSARDFFTRQFRMYRPDYQYPTEGLPEQLQSHSGMNIPDLPPSVPQERIQVAKLGDAWSRYFERKQNEVLIASTNLDGLKVGPPPVAITDKNDLRALSIIRAGESDATGGYNAVNQGGAEGGRKVLGYSGPIGGHPKHTGKELTSMTIGEIKKLQNDDGYGHTKKEWQRWYDDGGLHAVGAYQFVGNTLPEAAQLAGFSDDALFTPETQDAMAIALLNKYGPSKWTSVTTDPELLKLWKLKQKPSTINK